MLFAIRTVTSDHIEVTVHSCSSFDVAPLPHGWGQLIYRCHYLNRGGRQGHELQ